jgi:hypothetical protein
VVVENHREHVDRLANRLPAQPCLGELGDERRDLVRGKGLGGAVAQTRQQSIQRDAVGLGSSLAHVDTRRLPRLGVLTQRR